MSNCPTIGDGGASAVDLSYDDLDTGLGATNFQDAIEKLYSKLITTALTGTVTVSAASDAVVGIGTLFTTELIVGQAIKIAGEVKTINSIGDNLNLVLSSNHTAGAAGVTAYKE